MGKNKNKNKYVPKNSQPIKPVLPTKPALTEEQKLEIEVKNEELQTTEPVEQLSPESESKFKESDAKDDLLKYWNYVKEINKKLDSLLNSTKDEKEKATKLKDELDASKKDVERIKADLKKKLEDQNKKDKELTEREFTLDNGEYTAVIRRLLDSIKDTERSIFIDAENRLKELSEFHKKNLDDFSQHITLNLDFEKQQADLKREKKKFEVDKKIFDENMRDEYETKYSEQLSIKTAELERLQRKANNLEHENANLKQLFEDLQNAFESKIGRAHV